MRKQSPSTGPLRGAAPRDSSRAPGCICFTGSLLPCKGDYSEVSAQGATKFRLLLRLILVIMQFAVMARMAAPAVKRSTPLASGYQLDAAKIHTVQASIQDIPHSWHEARQWWYAGLPRWLAVPRRSPLCCSEHPPESLRLLWDCSLWEGSSELCHGTPGVSGKGIIPGY